MPDDASKGWRDLDAALRSAKGNTLDLTDDALRYLDENLDYQLDRLEARMEDLADVGGPAVKAELARVGRRYRALSKLAEDVSELRKAPAEELPAPLAALDRVSPAARNLMQQMLNGGYSPQAVANSARKSFPELKRLSQGQMDAILDAMTPTAAAAEEAVPTAARAAPAEVPGEALPRTRTTGEAPPTFERRGREVETSGRLVDEHGQVLPKGDVFDEVARSEAPSEVRSVYGPSGELLYTEAQKGGRGGAAATARYGEVTQPSPETLKAMPNLKYLGTDMPEVQATIMANARLEPELINSYKRGTISHDRIVNELAIKFGMKKEDYLKTPAGKAFNEAELFALRATVADNHARLVTRARQIDEMEGGVRAMTPEAKAAFMDDILEAAQLQAIGTGAASTAGRTLNQQRIALNRETSRRIVSGIEEKAAARASQEAQKRADAAAKRIADLEKKAAQRELDRAEKEALRKARLDEREAQRTKELADRRQARESARQEKVHQRDLSVAKRALEQLGPENVTDELMEEFVKLINSKDTMAMGKFLKGTQKVNWMQRGNLLRYAGMLSSTATHGVQAASNLLQLGLIPATHAFAVPFDIMAQTLGKGERTRYWGEIGAMGSGAKAGFREGLEEAKVVMRTGINPRSMAQDIEHLKKGKMAMQPGFAFGQTMLGKAIGRRASGVVDVAAEAPLRLMQASDLLFRGAARGMHTNALAMRKALSEGYKGEEAAKRAMEIFQNLDEHIELVDEAEKLSRRAVLQEETWISRLPRTGPVGTGISWVVPFLRTPYNVAAQGLGMTPLGYLSAAKAAREGKRGEAVDRVARASLGTAIFGGAGLLAAEGHMTAGYPQDAAERSTLPPGWKPWSFRVVKPDGEAVYIPFGTLGPVGVPFALAATVGDAYRSGKPLDDKLVYRAVANIGRYMADQSMLMGLSNAINSVVDPERYAERFIESTASQFMPYSGLQRQIQQFTGQAPRDPEGAIDALLTAFVPTSGMVKPRLTALGEEASTGQTGIGALMPVRYGTGRDTPVLEALRGRDVLGEGYRGAEVNIPKGAEIRKGVPFTPEEQRRHQRWSGQIIKEETEAFMRTPEYQRMLPSERQQYLERLVAAAREEAAGYIFDRMGEAEAMRRYDEEQRRLAPVPTR